MLGTRRKYPWWLLVTIKVERSEAPLASFYVERQLWMKHAACKDTPTDYFFDFTRFAECRKICRDCPVRRDCAEQAMVEEGSAPGGRYGFRGGLTPTQRRTLYRRGGLKGRDPVRISGTLR